VSELISREEFLRAVSESELISSDDLRGALRATGGGTGGSDVGTLAQDLVGAGRLTRFQADVILAGRSHELSIGNYIVLNRLGAGGMGTVFKACHRRMKRIVALKILSRDSAAESSFAQRFQREVETIAQLSHPNIVMAFDAGEGESGLFLVMEFVDGRDLGSEVAQAGPLAAADAVESILQAARGLNYAHSHGVVHRDVKPANLLRATNGLVKVADLGLARITSESTSVNASLTQAGSLLGTADYMAPEQALDSAAVDHRVDVYSLGCTLFYLLAGRPLYSAGSLMALLLKHRDAPIPSLAEARPEVPAELDALFRRMAAKRPEDRFSTMAAVVQALEGLKGAVALSGVRPARGRQVQANASEPDATVIVDPAATVGPCDFGLTVAESGVADAPTSSVIRQLADLKVVVVEPSRAQASIVRKYLQDLGIPKVRATGSGREALELAKQERTDVIFSSMHLTDMTGVQLAGALHADPGCAGIGLVLASSDSDSGDMSKVLNDPHTVILPKPFDLVRLAKSLTQATGRVVDEVLSK
jgi:serine/threonine-protein kinase